VKGRPVEAKTILEGVQVRADADDKSAVIATLKKGENVKAYDHKGAYWKVKLADGKEGYVSVASLQTKMGINGVKDAVKGAATPPPSQATSPSAVDSAKSAINGKVDELKAKPNAPAAKDSETNGQKLEKAANGLFNK
ncbi:MAG: SH3 domain-containing protein, partial [Proteobacteria bacterium]|nr:SH3 domain-containing protein [Pseudomonadota bacterium]